MDKTVVQHYQDTIKIIGSTIEYLLGKNGVPYENRSADAVADLSRTLLEKVDYTALLNASAPEEIEALKTVSGWNND